MKNLALKNLQKEILALANPAKAKILMGFFKTGPGEYGEGDKFLGIVVPEQRKLVRKYLHLSLLDIKKIITSKFHEKRLIALLILVAKFARTSESEQAKIYKFYLGHTKYINNWDLVDLTADRIVGAYLLNKNKLILLKLAKSKDLWERRIAMLSTFHYIKQGQTEWPLKIAKILLNDQHDLIQKAVGWMLREIGKRCDEKILLNFLDTYYKEMPRTCLRYAIERLPEVKRQHYLK